MTDDLTKRRPQDALKINIHEAWELNYWSKVLGVSEKQVIAAVNTVGVLVINVKKYLSK